MINDMQRNTPPRKYGATYCGNRTQLACSSQSPLFVPASTAASFVPPPPLSSSVSQPDGQNGAVLLNAFRGKVPKLSQYLYVILSIHRGVTPLLSYKM